MAGTWAIVVAAGAGHRFGGPKQFEPLAGRRVVDHAVDSALRHCDGVVVALPPDRLDSAPAAPVRVVAGGATRSDSVRAALAAVPDDAGAILVHDAARPAAPDDVWRRVIGALAAGAEVVVPALPVTDTLRRVGGSTIDRSDLVAVQTPEGFTPAVLRAAHADGAQGSDDASLAEAIGAVVVVVQGDPANLKVTTPLDLVLAEVLCR